MPMSRRLTILLLVLCMLALMCGLTGGACKRTGHSSTGVDCAERAIESLFGSYACQIATLALLARDLGVAQVDTRELTDATLHFGAEVAAAGVHASQADEVQFWANRPDGPAIMMNGTFSMDGSDVTIHLAPVAQAAAGQPQSITMNLTMSDDEHGAGTLSYVESGNTYQGDVDIEKYPDQ